MLDEKDLQTIKELFTLQDSRIAQMFAQQKKEIMHEVSLLTETEVAPKLNLLVEGQESILEKLVPRSRVDDLEEEVRFLKSIVRQMNEDLQALKKAN